MQIKERDGMTQTVVSGGIWKWDIIGNRAGKGRIVGGVLLEG